MMRLAIGVVMLLGIAVPREASATCAPPDASWSPSGGPLPPNPTVYLFVPMGHDATFTSNVPISTELVDRSGSFAVHRVRIHATTGVVRIDAPGLFAKTVAEYTIGEAAPNASLVMDVRHLHYFGMCSGSDALEFDIAGTATAYRFDWHDSATPTYMSARDPALGYLWCGANNVESAIKQERGFELVALYADGSERRLGASTLMIGASHVRRPTELLGYAGQIEEKLPIREHRYGYRDEPLDDVDLGWFGVLAGLGSLVLATRRLSHHIADQGSARRTLPVARIHREGDARS
jgi:hypothetical protein